ncbi:hypothetical protein ACM7HA_17910 [Pseudomonas aeruginosa]|uniref:hypothetical protein n=1 Tax=Pseudomonas aeruginosa TaxID=287 RepID=UPI00071C01B8|nr:hypothetical protein [Pseudomonas aeruginosa]KSE91523.1 hypothetical protein AO934_27030 [Pseudomonas aeruginosa]MBG6660419.1 hypothetical protein [Pseudomonas aeruginosa]MCS9316099.1 hypothetical protein [Pseudomonas aeruginosa]MCT0556545.1 hypothetical protein [Pseudomonas aeruginosa]MDJ1362213.1 hypothetical protein [Pseudomonas aeruginosa]
MKLLRVFAAVLMFVGILAGCLALLLLVILLVRFPPLLIAVVLACWILSQLMEVFRAPEAAPAKPPTSSQ